MSQILLASIVPRLNAQARKVFVP